MLVINWMRKAVITVAVDDALDRIRMLPVLKKGALVGVVTDRDLKRASASDATSLDVHELLYLISTIKIKDIMTKDPVTVTPDLTVEETAELMLKHKLSGAPVVEKGGRVVGTITQSDLFPVLISLTGVGVRGIQFAFLMEDRPGSIKEVADTLRSFGGRMVSILTSYDRVPEGKRKVYIRMHGIDRSRLSALKEAVKAKAQLLYLVDHKENRREIY